MGATDARQAAAVVELPPLLQQLHLGYLAQIKNPAHLMRCTGFLIEKAV